MVPVCHVWQGDVKVGRQGEGRCEGVERGMGCINVFVKKKSILS